MALAATSWYLEIDLSLPRGSWELLTQCCKTGPSEGQFWSHKCTILAASWNHC